MYNQKKSRKVVSHTLAAIAKTKTTFRLWMYYTHEGKICQTNNQKKPKNTFPSQDWMRLPKVA